MPKQMMKIWVANVKILIHNLAWDVFYAEDKFQGLRVLTPKTRYGIWLVDGKLCFDVGLNLKGWLRFEARNISATRSPLINKIDKGVFCTSLIKNGDVFDRVVGAVSVGEVDMLKGDGTVSLIEKEYKFKRGEFAGESRVIKVYEVEGHIYQLPPELPTFPLHTFVEDQKGQSRVKLWYDTRDPIEVWVSIHSHAYGITPDDIKQMLELLGKSHGLGARHKQGQNGLFDLLEFRQLEETTLKITG